MTAPDLQALARQFISNTAGRHEAWPVLLATWPPAQGLTEHELRELRTSIIRARVWGLVEAPRPAARPRRGRR
jgi:hypothetical protein